MKNTTPITNPSSLHQQQPPMARKKVKLEWITNDSSRRATFKKRRKGLLKKVSELSTLCGVNACMIVYGPNETTPEVWPSVPDAMRVHAKLKRLPEMEQSKKMLNQEGFLRQRIAKLDEQVRKQEKENREIETTILMHRGLEGRGVHDLSIDDVTILGWLIEIKIEGVKKRIGLVKKDMASMGVKVERTVVAKGKEKVAVATKEKRPLEVAMEELPRQEWFTEIMGSHDQNVIPGAEQMMMHSNSYVNHTNPWMMMDGYFTFR